MRDPEASAYEAALVAELRKDRDGVRRLLTETKRELRETPTGLCYATDRARTKLQGERATHRALLCLYRSRLDQCFTLEEWLRRRGGPGSAQLVYPDHRLRSTRLAWVDSLIKELCE